MVDVCACLGAVLIIFGLFYFALNVITRIATGTSVHDRLAQCCHATEDGDYDYKMLCSHFETYAVRDFMTRACFDEFNAQLADGRMALWDQAPKRAPKMEFIDFICQYKHAKFEAYARQPVDKGKEFSTEAKIYGVVNNRRIFLANVDTYYMLLMDFIIRDRDFEPIAKIVRRLVQKGFSYDELQIPIMDIYNEACKSFFRRVWESF